MAKCAVCGNGPAPEHGGVTVFRQNAVGELPAVWACREHRTAPPDPDVERIVDALETPR